MNEIANSQSQETSVADAFRSPTTSSASRKSDGLRSRLYADQPIVARRILPTGFAAVWAIVFPDATVIEISGRINTTLKIYPTHVQADNRRWFSSTSLLARYVVTIPVYDEVGDTVIHQLHIRSALAFLYPFVPMHVEVAIDDNVIFGQGKFDR